jgi:SAM-dependent methyltransferase
VRTEFRALTETARTRADADQMAMAQLRHSLVATLAKGRDLLDVACGSGYALSLIAREARSVVACDRDEANVRDARAAAPSASVHVADAENLRLEAASFDVVACLEAIYYFRDWRGFLADAHRLLREDGALLVTWPNPSRPAFSRSQSSTVYPEVDEIVAAATRLGFDATCYGGFPLQSLATAGRPWVDAVRRTVVRLHLIPRSLRLRALIKRLLYRRLQPLSDVELMLDPFDHLTALAPGAAAPYAMLYLVAYKVPGATA